MVADQAQYQVLGARFAHELLAWDTPEMRAFRRFYEAADRTPEVVVRTMARLGASDARPVS